MQNKHRTRYKLRKKKKKKGEREKRRGIIYVSLDSTGDSTVAVPLRYAVHI